LTLKKYEKGSYIFKFRENSDAAFFLIKGKISVKTPRILKNETNKKNANENFLKNFISIFSTLENLENFQQVENNILMEQQQLDIQKNYESSLLLLNDPSKKLCKIKIF